MEKGKSSETIKMRTKIILLCLLGLVLAACGTASTSNAPTSLPTAVPPAGMPGVWSIGFKYDFPHEFWGPGEHRYGFLVACPFLEDGRISTEWQYFQVSEDALIQPATIYLRVSGLSNAVFSTVYLDNMVMHPRQQTAAVIYLLGISQEDAESAASECEALISWDQAGRAVLETMEPFQP